MRACVAAIVPVFSAPLEGSIYGGPSGLGVPWMYLDVLGLVTTALGLLIDASTSPHPQPIDHPEAPALSLPWVHLDGQAASVDEIRAEWWRVKLDKVAARRGYRYTEGITDLRLTRDGMQVAVERKLVTIDRELAHRFPEYDEWPADAQLGVISLSWACGAGFHFPRLEAALRVRDFETAVRECTIDENGADHIPRTADDNAGVHPRNLANRILFSNAARVQAFHLDPDVLIWPGVLDEEATNSASSPTLYPLPPEGGEHE